MTKPLIAKYALGIDIGSTTVKYVVCDEHFNILQKAYTPHDTKQAPTLLRLLQELSLAHPDIYNHIDKVYITGSGATRIAPTINARFVQEVNAVVLAVEHLHPDVRAVVELGGQDAKIMHFKVSEDGKKSVLSSMNDKCASGTGATIEKCTMKVGMESDEVQKLSFETDKLHHVAAKCGVFAETDIVNLVKTSVPSHEIMNSLADAIVMQNLTVLTRGNTLMPKVLLLGGPNTYLPFLQECWRMRISELWDERGVQYDKEKINELIIVPDNAQYYAALGAVIFGEGEANHDKPFTGLIQLKTLVDTGGVTQNENDDTPLVSSPEELQAFQEEYTIKTFTPPLLTEKTTCFLGIDGGSTSSKAVLCDAQGELLLKVYQLSKGNPIEDTLELLQKIQAQDPHHFYDIQGLGVTGYAADVLGGALNADANIIETIAHMKSAQKAFGEDINVICDIGGQDIKVLFMENGMMKNFRLSNQCSAGNGTLLQSMAKQFGVPVENYAYTAFTAKKAPLFNYGCAVFLDTDRVNFQKEGYSKEELFAGIAKVLPKNVWQYVVQAPNLAAFGDHFVLQGGTQYNQAALKAQVDYIKEKVPHARVDVHPHPGEAGAYGAALEAKDMVEQRGYATFVGMEEALQMTYTSRTDESTRCHFCSINCSRTFIDTQTPSSDTVRYIAGFSCEEGTVESHEALKLLKEGRKALQKNTPNLVKKESMSLFAPTYDLETKPTAATQVKEQQVKVTLGGWGPTLRKEVTRNFLESSQESKTYRKNLQIAIPKVLNVYSLAPFLRTYLEALDLSPMNIQFSGFSNEDMFLEGAKYGSVDSCYPAKVAQSHVYSLMYSKKFSKKHFDHLWFPAVTHLPGYLKHTMGQTSCPIISGTPKVVYSAFTKEKNLFEEKGIDYVEDALNFDNHDLLKKQLFHTWRDKLRITEDENNWAVEQAWKALDQNDAKIMQEGRSILDEAVANDEIVILLLGRPYHSDPGLNHEVLDEFQSLGFKTLSMRAIPKDEDYLMQYFKEDVDFGYVESPYDIRDVWAENFSTNSAQKVWAAKFAARHPNVAVLDLSSFKCGHDAPTYAIIDKILGASRTPHLTLHDIDANKPGGSIKIRVKTFAYTLEQYQKRLTHPQQTTHNPTQEEIRV
ncbi:acyl-CoA dehydratase activase-related protein [Sulfurovum sp. XTW-4]|uniref:Acyl-CoA dehydratase activase-related protein n=1 Tax=Sulfurovum xiamenensis TaxID=3019066 RepID=A0ABT7QQC3_9BACT|nr:BadF/BadG/BcrA/BcrD ATPase family protein [Sulfurovum xiamenensis]MDM5263054.1 acyl-CoA dehydratase activase-related protein [Sulfurovum xiamenensis]